MRKKKSQKKIGDSITKSTKVDLPSKKRMNSGGDNDFSKQKMAGSTKQIFFQKN